MRSSNLVTKFQLAVELHVIQMIGRIVGSIFILKKGSGKFSFLRVSPSILDPLVLVHLQ